jgi:uncharacterized membrane protein
MATHSALSLALIAWLVAAPRRAESSLLGEPAPWQWHIPFVLTPVATFLLVPGLLAPNPLSISSHSGSGPGAITSITRHPITSGFLIRALTHIPANGDLFLVLLCGGMGAFSHRGFLILDAKARCRLGIERWCPLARKTAVVRGPVRGAAVRSRILAIPARRLWRLTCDGAEFALQPQNAYAIKRDGEDRHEGVVMTRTV